MPEFDWLVSPLTDDDCDELGRVHVAVWRDAYAGLMPAEYLAGLDAARFAANWRGIVGRRGPGEVAGSTFVARNAAGRLVGFVSAGPSRDPDPPTEWELYAVNLLREAQGSGLADTLLDVALDDRPVTLWVVEGNARARAFYTRRGFVDEGGRSKHDATEAPEIRMIRRA